MSNLDASRADPPRNSASEAAAKAVATESTGPAGARRRSVSSAELFQRYGLVLVWGVVFAVFSVLRPETFFTLVNIQTILSSQSVLLVLTLALLLPLTVGEFDLSIAGVFTLTVILVGYLNVTRGWPIGVSIGAAIATSVLIGIVNAALVLIARADSIVVTLGMGTLLAGVSFGVTEVAIAGISPAYVEVVRHRIFGVQLAFWIALLLTVLIWYVFVLTPLGRYLHFVGASREVARLSGIRVNAIRAGSFIASSLMSCAAGLLMVGLQGSADPNVGSTFLLPAFAGAFLGATAITPGRFNPWGTFIAVYFLTTGITGLEIMGLSGWINQVFYGGSLIIAVALSRAGLGGYLRSRAKRATDKASDGA